MRGFGKSPETPHVICIDPPPLSAANFFYFNRNNLDFRNLYQSQKLLSVSMDAALPLWEIPTLRDEIAPDVWSWEQARQESETTMPSFPAFGLILLLCVVAFTACRFFRRTRRRRRRPKIKKAINGVRVPVV